MKHSHSRTRVRVGCSGKLLPNCILLLLGFSAGMAKADNAAPELSSLPPAVLGTWKVKSVHVDLGSGRRMAYQWNDPDLVGDVITISDNEIVSNTPEARQCLHPKVATWRTTASSLIAETLAGHGYPSESPTVKDYDLPLAPNSLVEAYAVQCNLGHFGPYQLKPARLKFGIKDGTWIIVLPGGRLAVRWYDQTILILGKVKSSAK